MVAISPHIRRAVWLALAKPATLRGTKLTAAERKIVRAMDAAEESDIRADLAAGPVSLEEKELAKGMAAEQASLQALGLRAATRIGFRAQKAAQRAYEGRGDVLGRVEAELARAAAVVRDAMLAGYLTGLLRGRLTLPGGPIIAASATRLALAADGEGGAAKLPLPAPSTGYEGSLSFLKRRLGLTTPDLEAVEERFEAEAFRVVRRETAAVERKLQRTLLDLTEAGAHVREGKAALHRAFNALGLTPDNSFTLEAIFRTQTALAYGAGRWAMDQSEEVQEILWGYKYVTVGDDRVRPTHVGLDGVTLPKDDDFWQTAWPPNGWACRCAAIPIFEERAAVRPKPLVEVDGKMVKPGPDKGFEFNAGKVLPPTKEMVAA